MLSFYFEYIVVFSVLGITTLITWHFVKSVGKLFFLLCVFFALLSMATSATILYETMFALYKNINLVSAITTLILSLGLSAVFGYYSSKFK